MAETTKAIRVRVTGRVQGVGFRDWVRRQADELGLKGWVRNEPGGSVAGLIVGPEDKVAEMIQRLWKGPRLASVSDVKIEPAVTDEMPDDFRIV